VRFSLHKKIVSMKILVNNSAGKVKKYKDGTTASFTKVKSNGKTTWKYCGGSPSRKSSKKK
jgi:hypothetical protein